MLDFDEIAVMLFRLLGFSCFALLGAFVLSWAWTFVVDFFNSKTKEEIDKVTAESIKRIPKNLVP